MEYLCERAMPFVVGFLALLVVIFIPIAISAYQSVSTKGWSFIHRDRCVNLEMASISVVLSDKSIRIVKVNCVCVWVCKFVCVWVCVCVPPSFLDHQKDPDQILWSQGRI